MSKKENYARKCFRGLRENVVLIVAHNGMFDIIIILFNLISNLIRKIKSFHTKSEIL